MWSFDKLCAIGRSSRAYIHLKLRSPPALRKSIWACRLTTSFQTSWSWAGSAKKRSWSSRTAPWHSAEGCDFPSCTGGRLAGFTAAQSQKGPSATVGAERRTKPSQPKTQPKGFQRGATCTQTAEATGFDIWLLGAGSSHQSAVFARLDIILYNML